MPTFDSGSKTRTSGSVNGTVGYNFNVTVGSGADRVLVVWVMARCSPDPGTPTITAGGNAMNEAVFRTSGLSPGRDNIYTYPAPATGTVNVAVSYPTFNNTLQYCAHAFVVNGVDQTTPVDDTYDNAAGAQALATITLVPTEDNEFLFAVARHESNSAASNTTGDTTIYDDDLGAFGASSAYFIQTTAASRDMTFDWTGNENMIALGITLRASSANDPPATPTLESPADASNITDTTPEVQFNAVDPDADDVRYNVQITDNAEFLDGINVIHDQLTGFGTNIHPNPSGGTTWLGDPQVDDRPGASFRAKGGILDSVTISFGPHETSPELTDGTYLVRVYNAAGTVVRPVPAAWQASTAYSVGDYVRPTSLANANVHFYFRCKVAGTTGGTEPTWPGSAPPGFSVAWKTVTELGETSDGTVTWETVAGSHPENPADPADTPTPGWIAQSESYAYNPGGPDGGTKTLSFVGANRIRLTADAYYMVILDWIPNDTNNDNTLNCGNADLEDATELSNTYIDGASQNNNGPRIISSLKMSVSEDLVNIDVVSGTDAGFANVDTPADTDPFNSGDTVSYTVQAGDALRGGVYSWRVRAIDPAGSGGYGDWSSNRTFTLGEGLINASAFGSSTATVNIGSDSNLVASADGTSEATAGIQGFADTVAASDGTSAAAVAANAFGNAAASSDGTSDATALVDGQTELIVSSDGTSSASVAIIGYGDLVASADGTSEAVAAIGEQQESDISGVSQGSSTSTANITALGHTVASTNGLSESTVAIVGLADAVLDSSGTSSATVGILGYTDTVAVADGTSDATAAISYLADGDIIGLSQGTSTAAALIAATGEIVTVSAGTSTSAAAIEGVLNTQDIAGVSGGSTTATVAIAGRGTIYCSTSGSVTVTALIESSGTINIVLAAAGTSSATAAIYNANAAQYGTVEIYDESVYDVAVTDSLVYSLELVDYDQPS